MLTGDTLFIGDVGRPDLLASLGVTADELGGMLYDSLHQKLLTLPDGTRVWPAHGAGSACGKNLSTATMSTIGEQRATNYALQPMSRQRFVELVTEGQPAAPDYFVHDAILNRRRRGLLDESAPRPLTVDEVLAARRRGAVLLDVRDAAAFTAGHLAGSVNVGLDGRFAEYAGEVIDPSDEIVVLAEPGTAVEAKIRLGRIGFDNVVGALEGVEAALVERPEEARQASRLTASELDARIEDTPGLQVVDVRSPGEVAAGSDRRCGQPPAGRAPAPGRRARPRSSDRRPLRRRVPLRDRRQLAALGRCHRRVRSARRVHGVVRTPRPADS